MALEELPSAIWMPTACFAKLPSCYNGSPLEMVEQMAKEMGPQLGVHDTIDLLIEYLSDQRDIRVHLPSEEGGDVLPEEVRAGLFVAILLDAGVAQPMPGA
jgi:hypothetical protein